MSIKILWLEIDGWGQVSERDYSLIDVVVAVSGTAVLRFTGTTSAFSDDEIGATVWIEGLSAVNFEDGHYTLTAHSTGGGETSLTVTGDPADMPTGTHTGAFALVRLEDFYKIATGIPTFVTGSLARARWHVGITAFTDTIGQTVKHKGGIASSDGFTITHTTYYEAVTARLTWDVMGEGTTGPVMLATELARAATAGSSLNDGPFLGGGGAAPSAHAVLDASWLGVEAVRIVTAALASTTDGVETYDFSAAARGMLRTYARTQPRGATFLASLPTLRAQIGRVFSKIDAELDEYFDADLVYVGTIDDTPLVNGMAAQNIMMSSNLLTFHTRASKGEALIAEWAASAPIHVNIGQHSSETLWQWVRIGRAAARLIPGSEDLIDVSEETGLLTFEYQVDGLIQSSSDFIILEAAEDFEDWRRYARSLDDYVDSDRTDPTFRRLALVSDNPDTGDLQIRSEAIEALEVSVVHVFEGTVFPTVVSPPDVITEERFTAVNPVEMIAQVLATRNGDSVNTWSDGTTTYNFDVIPAELGLGLGDDLVDVPSFITIANRMKDEQQVALSAFLGAKEAKNISKWLDGILRAYFLAIVTGKNGKIRLVDLAADPFSASLVSLDDGDIYVEDGKTLEVSYEGGNDRTIDSVEITFDRPYLNPDDPWASQRDIVRGTDQGVQQLFGRIATPIVNDSAFALSFLGGSDEMPPHANRAAVYLRRFRYPTPEFSITVHRAWAGENGDLISMAFDQLPQADGSFSSDGFTGVGFLASRVQGIQAEIDVLKIWIEAGVDNTAPIQWAATGEVSAVTSDTVFFISASKFSDGDNYANDWDAFQVGDEILLFDRNWTLLSVDVGPVRDPQTISAINAATGEITISSAFTDIAGVPITPTAGARPDRIVHADKSLQTSTTQAAFAWQSSTPPGDRWA